MRAMSTTETLAENARFIEVSMDSFAFSSMMIGEPGGATNAVPTLTTSGFRGARVMAENPSTTNPSKPAIEANAEYVVPYPFCWDLASKPGDDPEGPHSIEFMSWRPGVRYEFVYPDDSEAIADGEGAQILSVVAVFKPGRFPARVFYTRKWRAPNGYEFGKGALRVKTLDAFRRLASGYQHEYRLATGTEFFEHAAEERAKSHAAISKAEGRA